MRYRVSTLLLAMTVTAIAVASRPWLASQRNDFGVGIALFSMWAATGFLMGWSASRWENRRLSLLAIAASAVIANWALWYCWRVAVEFLRSPDNIMDSRTSVLSWLLKIDDMHAFSLIAAASIVFILYAAWKRHEQLLAAGVAISLLTWFAIYWAAFLWTAASTAPID
jgi:hypothetical protein